MQQIADWLEKLGMSEYVERFAENKIDAKLQTPPPHCRKGDNANAFRGGFAL